jgi:hypothetical protein
MYRGAMEPTWTSGGCPGGGVLTGRLLGNRGWGLESEVYETPGENAQNSNAEHQP